MKRILILAGLLVVVAGWLYFSNSGETQTPQEESFGVYAYRCGDGSEFYIEPSLDFSYLHIYPATSVDYVPDAILLSRASDTGARFEGSGIVLHGHGEVVQLSSEKGTTPCSPIFSPDEAPLNFGD